MKLVIMSALVTLGLLACGNQPQQVYQQADPGQQQQPVVVQQQDPQIIIVPGHPLFSDPYYHSYGYYHSSYYHPYVNHVTVYHSSPVIRHTVVVRPSYSSRRR